MRFSFKWAFLLLSLLAISGCVRREIIDDVSLINGIGFDSTKGENISGTIFFPLYLKEREIQNLTMTATDSVKRTIIQEIQRKAPYPVVMGSLEIILFEDKLAKEGGILELVDAFQRDPAVGSNIYLAITEGKTKDVFNGEFGTIINNADYIARILEHNMKKEDLPKSNIQKFLVDFYQQGKSPYLPVIKQTDKKNVEITGIALIRLGKMVDFIARDDTFFFKLMTDKFINGLHEIELEDGSKAAIQSIRSSNRMELNGKNPYEVTCHIRLKGIINEFTGNKISPEVMDEIEKQFEKEIEEKCTEFINRFQKKEIDPIGFGHFVKTQTRKFDYKKWSDSEYQRLVVKIKPEVEVSEAGVIK